MIIVARRFIAALLWCAAAMFPERGGPSDTGSRSHLPGEMRSLEPCTLAGPRGDGGWDAARCQADVRSNGWTIREPLVKWNRKIKRSGTLDHGLRGAHNRHSSRRIPWDHVDAILRVALMFLRVDR